MICEWLLWRRLSHDGEGPVGSVFAGEIFKSGHCGGHLNGWLRGEQFSLNNDTTSPTLATRLCISYARVSTYIQNQETEGVR